MTLVTSYTKAAIDTAVAGLKNKTFSRKTADYTLVLGDAGKVIEMNTAIIAGWAKITVPTNASVAFPIGTTIHGAQYGEGQFSFHAAVGVTIRHFDGPFSAGQYAWCSITKVATDEWYLYGMLTPTVVTL